ncbi:MAG TPA: hypothetical protein VFK54_10430 [Candidatus Limnocylindrales bacterium]|nr:hypothetical protein [Candidatus Limnocylindrales bacterium]
MKLVVGTERVKQAMPPGPHPASDPYMIQLDDDDAYRNVGARDARDASESDAPAWIAGCIQAGGTRPLRHWNVSG